MIYTYIYKDTLHISYYWGEGGSLEWKIRIDIYF